MAIKGALQIGSVLYVNKMNPGHFIATDHQDVQMYTRASQTSTGQVLQEILQAEVKGPNIASHPSMKMFRNFLILTP
jgi:hypothetical protein